MTYLKQTCKAQPLTRTISIDAAKGDDNQVNGSKEDIVGKVLYLSYRFFLTMLFRGQPYASRRSLWLAYFVILNTYSGTGILCKYSGLALMSLLFQTSNHTFN